MKHQDTTLVELQNALLAVFNTPGKHVTVTRELLLNTIDYIRKLKNEINKKKNKK